MKTCEAIIDLNLFECLNLGIEGVTKEMVIVFSHIACYSRMSGSTCGGVFTVSDIAECVDMHEVDVFRSLIGLSNVGAIKMTPIYCEDSYTRIVIPYIRY